MDQAHACPAKQFGQRGQQRCSHRRNEAPVPIVGRPQERTIGRSPPGCGGSGELPY